MHYPVDSDLSSGWCNPFFEQLGPELYNVQFFGCLSMNGNLVSSANILPHPMLQLWLIVKKTMWMTALLSVLILFAFQLLSLVQPLVTASIKISLTAASTFNAMVANYTIKGVPRDSYLIQKSRPVIGPRTWCAHKCTTEINTNDGRDVLGFQ